jgi:sugar O-acyltransferase (sialic acid O-acetyltransferase NeuD family)
MKGVAPRSYAMLGQGNLFGDFVDLIHSCGGHLARVVTNVPDPAGRSRPFAERLAEYNAYKAKLGLSPAVEVSLEQYGKEEGEAMVLGFHVLSAAPALVERVKRVHGVEFPALVHASAWVSPLATLAEGVCVGANATVAPGVKLGPFAYINRAASVGHDCRIGTYSSVSPGAHLAGSVEVGERVFIGTGAVVIPERRIGTGAVVAAGAVVTEDVPEWTLAAGVPAQVKKTLRPC